MNFGFPNPNDSWAIASVSEEGRILVLKEGVIQELTLSFFFDKAQKGDDSIEDLMVFSKDGWTKVLAVHTRNLWNGELLFRLKTRSAGIYLTKDTVVPTIRDRKEILVKVEHIKQGDSVVMLSPLKLKDHLKGENLTRSLINQGVLSLDALTEAKCRLVALETASGFFSVNDVLIYTGAEQL